MALQRGPSVKVAHPYDPSFFLTINEADYDESVHTLWAEDPQPTAEPALTPAAIEEEGDPSSLIDLNTADIETIATIPYINDDRAIAIAEKREELGGFASLDQVPHLRDEYHELVTLGG